MARKRSDNIVESKPTDYQSARCAAAYQNSKLLTSDEADTLKNAEIERGKDKVRSKSTSKNNASTTKSTCKSKSNKAKVSNEERLARIKQLCIDEDDEDEKSDSSNDMYLTDLDFPEFYKPGSGIYLKYTEGRYAPNRKEAISYDPKEYEPEGYEDDLFESDADDEMLRRIEEFKAKSPKKSKKKSNPCSSKSGKEKVNNENPSINIMDFGFPYGESAYIDELLRKQRLKDERSSLTKNKNKKLFQLDALLYPGYSCRTPPEDDSEAHSRNSSSKVPTKDGSFESFPKENTSKASADVSTKNPPEDSSSKVNPEKGISKAPPEDSSSKINPEMGVYKVENGSSDLLQKNSNKVHFEDSASEVVAEDDATSLLPPQRLRHNFADSMEFQYFMLNVIPGLDFEDDDEEIQRRMEENDKIEKQKRELEAARKAAEVSNSDKKLKLSKGKGTKSKGNKPCEVKASAKTSKKNVSAPKYAKEPNHKGSKVTASDMACKKHENAVVSTTIFKTKKRKISVVKQGNKQPKQKKLRLSASSPCRKKSKPSKEYVQKDDSKLTQLIKCETSEGKESSTGKKTSQSTVNLPLFQQSEKINKYIAHKTPKLREKHKKKVVASSTKQKSDQVSEGKYEVTKSSILPVARNGIKPQVRKKNSRRSLSTSLTQDSVQIMKKDSARQSDIFFLNKTSINETKTPEGEAAKLSKSEKKNSKTFVLVKPSLKAVNGIKDSCIESVPMKIGYRRKKDVTSVKKNQAVTLKDTATTLSDSGKEKISSKQSGVHHTNKTLKSCIVPKSKIKKD